MNAPLYFLSLPTLFLKVRERLIYHDNPRKQTTANSMAVLSLHAQPFLTLHDNNVRPISIARISSRERKVGTSAKKYKGLEVLYDDGYQNPKEKNEYLHIMREFITSDNGPPRWFCPLDTGAPINGAPVLLYLPGMDGIGLGLFMHHKALGRIFELRCMHIPFHDRTPFEGLVKFVEEELKYEHSIAPKRPIYLLGNSIGACLALAVAAHNPHIDIILVLINPGTSFETSQLQNLSSLSNILSNQQCISMTHFLNINLDNEIKMAKSSVEGGSHPLEALITISKDLSMPLQISQLVEKLPEDTFSWKVELLKSASNYTNSLLGKVKAEVLIIASCLDNIFPSKREAQRLQKLLSNCKIHYFEDHGHNLLMEFDVHLPTIIKCVNMYRHSSKFERISDFIPPSTTELIEMVESSQDFHFATSPAMFSTLNDGSIINNLSGVPNEGPVLLVGNHMLLGFEMIPLLPRFLSEKKVVIRGIGHPQLFPHLPESSTKGRQFFDYVNLCGTVPLSGKNVYRLLENGEFVLLYPGGHKEAIHRKGEEYKLLWPSKPEFVRMAAQLGATIVPFGVVGEDDLLDLILKFEDIMGLPFGKEMIKAYSQHLKLRENDDIEVFFPGLVPKIPGRFYYLFGKPITTRDKKYVIRNRKAASDLYLHVKSEVESMISYLLKKRDEDAYRNVVARSVFKAVWGSDKAIPAFDP